MKPAESSPAGAERTSARMHLRGIALVTAAFCVLPALDGIAKYLIGDYHVVQLVWARMLFQSVVVAAWLAARARFALPTSDRPLLLAAVVAVVWLANFPIIFSLAYLPLAAAFALLMTAPLMVTALSAPLLGEHVGIHRWAAVAVGFLGALVIIRPGLGVFHWAGFLPLLTAVLFALYQLGVRRLSTTHESIDILLYASLGPLLASCLLVPFFWTTPDGFAWGLMAIMGAGAGLGHFLLIAALRYAPASLLAPFMYIQLVSSAVFGLLVFGDIPDALTVVGAAIIVASGLYGMRAASRADR